MATNSSGDAAPFHIFQVIGIELEYMIVDCETLDIRPIADEVLKAVTGEYKAEAVVGELGWSNELVLHVIELKTLDPVADLSGLADVFQAHLRRIDAILEDFDALLMPTAMHPWMNPWTEMKLWPHGYSPIYEAYHRIFDCRGHGWANLQSTHVNLPFADDAEFERLHTAVRLLLPVMPALAAGSPVLDGKLTAFMDNRMEVYRRNSARIPSIAGWLIPEAVSSRREYEEDILGRMYRDIRPLDNEGILQREWLNSRGAIARFDRGAIEIRVLDIQEAPAADLAITWAIDGALRQIASQRWSPIEAQKKWEEKRLSEIFLTVIEHAEAGVLDDHEYLAALGFPGSRCTAGELWAHLIASIPKDGGASEFLAPLEVILDEGTLARRISRAVSQEGAEGGLSKVYRRLCECLRAGEMFIP